MASKAGILGGLGLLGLLGLVTMASASPKKPVVPPAPDQPIPPVPQPVPVVPPGTQVPDGWTEAPPSKQGTPDQPDLSGFVKDNGDGTQTLYKNTGGGGDHTQGHPAATDDGGDSGWFSWL